MLAGDGTAESRLGREQLQHKTTVVKEAEAAGATERDALKITRLELEGHAT